MSRPFRTENGQVNLGQASPVQTSPQELHHLLPQALHQDSNIGKAQKLEENLQDFAGVVKNFSMFEVMMSGLGIIATKADADWVAYFGEAIAEYIENSFVEGKKLPMLMQAPLRMLASAFGVKTQNGSEVKSSEDLMESKEQVIGAINVSMSYVAFADTVFQTIKNIKHRGHPPEHHSLLKNIFKYTCDFALPIVNTILMWSSAAGKKHLANAIQKLAPNNHNKDDVNGAMTSGNQDWLCGINSGLLAVRKFIEKFVSHDLGKILEPIFATYMSIASYKEGQRALKGEEEEHEEKYSLDKRDTSSFGKDLYGFAKEISKIFDVTLPDLANLTHS